MFKNENRVKEIKIATSHIHGPVNTKVATPQINLDLTIPKRILGGFSIDTKTHVEAQGSQNEPWERTMSKHSC